MNSYDVEFRKPGTVCLERYNGVIADSVESAITRVKEQIPNDYGSELKYELVSVKETACGVLLPKTKNTIGR